MAIAPTFPEEKNLVFVPRYRYFDPRNLRMCESFRGFDIYTYREKAVNHYE